MPYAVQKWLCFDDESFFQFIISVGKSTFWFPHSDQQSHWGSKLESSGRKNKNQYALPQIRLLKESIFLHGNIWAELCSWKVKAEFYLFCLNCVTEYWIRDVLCSTMYWFIIDRICNLKCRKHISKSSYSLLPWLNIILRLLSRATFWPNPQPYNQFLLNLLSAKNIFCNIIYALLIQSTNKEMEVTSILSPAA